MDTELPSECGQCAGIPTTPSSTEFMSLTHNRHHSWLDVAEKAISALQHIAHQSIEGIRYLPNPYPGDVTTTVISLKEIAIIAVEGIRDIGLACCDDDEEGGCESGLRVEQNSQMEKEQKE